MTFRAAVEATPEIAGAFRVGLRAVRAVDREKLSVQRPRALRGSIDLDGALADTYHDAHRWDYGIGVAQGRKDKVFWTEVHPARDSEIGVILNKLNWLRDWLRDSGMALNGLPREFIWIATGAIAITPRSPGLRKLATNGLVFKGGHFKIP